MLYEKMLLSDFHFIYQLYELTFAMLLTRYTSEKVRNVCESLNSLTSLDIRRKSCQLGHSHQPLAFSLALISPLYAR